MFWRVSLVVVAVSATTPISTVTFAAEIRVLSANVFTGVLDDRFRDFERLSGHKVQFLYATAGSVRNSVRNGEAGDLAIAARPMIDALERDGKIVAGTASDLARSAVAVVIRRGAIKPDVSSIDALKLSLLAAGSVSYPDPARGGATGILFVSILERLNLTADVKPKAKFPPAGHFAVELVARGEAEIAIAQPMEAMLQDGVEIVGLLPRELQDPLSFTFTAGVMALAKEPDAARALLQYLRSPPVQNLLKRSGMEPAVEH